MKLNRHARRGTVLVESAVVYPVVFLIVVSIILLGTAVFRFQQVAHIAREASRWASVHGALYASENHKYPASPNDVYTNAILPYAAGMQPDSLTYSVIWATDVYGNPYQAPTRTVLVTDPVSGQPAYATRSNTVSVTISYSWDTGLFGVIPVTATSVNTISY